MPSALSRRPESGIRRPGSDRDAAEQARAASAKRPARRRIAPACLELLGGAGEARALGDDDRRRRRGSARRRPAASRQPPAISTRDAARIAKASSAGPCAAAGGRRRRARAEIVAHDAPGGTLRRAAADRRRLAGLARSAVRSRRRVVRSWPSRAQTAFITRLALVPPKPKLLLSTASPCAPWRPAAPGRRRPCPRSDCRG